MYYNADNKAKSSMPSNPKRILITGFQAFHEHDPNPVELLLEKVRYQKSQPMEILTALLPVTWDGASQFSKAFRDWKNVDAVILTGLNSRIDTPQIEQRAINIQKSALPDNSGIFRSGHSVIDGAPDYLDTVIHTEELARAVSSAGFSVRTSLYAGRFVCNTLYYSMLYQAEMQKKPVLFVHVPKIGPTWTLDAMAELITRIAQEICDQKHLKNHASSRLFSLCDAEQFLYGFVNYERKNRVVYNESNYSLSRYKTWLEKQDNPHLRGKSIHVAGTKGKGCVCAITASILSAHGYRTGLYTSPHLVSIRERIRLDGKAISESDFADLAYDQYTLSSDLSNTTSYRTTFELITTMAFQYFRKQQTDWDVYETGMGGRLDCTNVILPTVSAINSVGMDHIDSLGNTLLKIAGEKAGIIKTGIPVISGRQVPVVNRYLIRKAQETGSTLTFAASQIPVKNIEADTDGSTFSARLAGKWYHHFRLNLPGKFQLDNCRLALAVVQSIVERGLISLADKAVYTGLSQCRWPGRFDSVYPFQNNQKTAQGRLIVDGAHNPFAVKTLLNSAKTLYPGRRLTVIFGCAGNKDAEQMLCIINTYADQIVVTACDNPRSVSADHLSGIAAGKGIPVKHCRDAESAVKFAVECIMQNDLVIITGSLYLSGECYGIFGMGDACLDIY